MEKAKQAMRDPEYESITAEYKMHIGQYSTTVFLGSQLGEAMGEALRRACSAGDAAEAERSAEQQAVFRLCSQLRTCY